MISEPLSLMYGIDLQARCLVGVAAEQEKTCFLVGTLSLKQDNQVILQLCVLEVDDDWVQITKRAFPHPAGEIWHVASSPIDSNIAATCHCSYNSKLKSGTSLWRLDYGGNALQLLTSFYPSEENAKCSGFDFHPDGKIAASSVNKSLHIVDIENSMKVSSIVSSSKIESKSDVRALAWNPHSSGNSVAFAYDGNVKGVDSRETFTIDAANTPNVRNLDFNPNVQYTLATCGDDCKVSFWDIRKTRERLKTLDDHSHWVWSVKFNPIHDQLILSAGSDARLFLNSVLSLSSEALHPFEVSVEDGETTSHKKLGDERMEKVEEHEESVYACAWASNDPWVFASLSYDGRLIISRVKRHHKYAILRL
uniref:WD_REPEATS_REGION domain-containing protein n=1 Tax=Syphacia muris TaxID=451379 RepID=A0A0N5AUK9_9BILA